MPIDLDATITVQESSLHISEPIWVMFIVTNQTASPVSVLNPDVGTPPGEINWTFSNGTYQISVLLSFHLIAISVVNPSGEKLPLVGPNPWVTPRLMPRLELSWKLLHVKDQSERPFRIPANWQVPFNRQVWARKCVCWR